MRQINIHNKMISELNNNSSELLQIITSITEAECTLTVRNAEKYLTQCEKYHNYLHLLFEIISLDHTSFNVRKLTSIFVFIYVRDRREMVGYGERRYIVQSIIRCLWKKEIDFSIKVAITNACSGMLAFDRENRLQTEIVSSLNHLFSTKDVIHLETCQQIVLVSLTLFKSFRSTQDHKYLVFRSQHLTLLLEYQQYLNHNLEVRTNAQIQQVIDCIKQLVLIVHFYFFSTQKDLLQNGQNQANYISDIFDALRNGLILDKFMVNPLFWLQQNNKTLSNKLSQLRFNLLLLMTTAIQQIDEENILKNSKNGYIVGLVATSILHNLDTMFVCPNPHLTTSNTEVIQLQMILLIQLGKKKVLSNLITQNNLSFMNIIKHMLAFSQKDVIQFEEEPMNFVNGLITFIDSKYEEQNEDFDGFLPFDQASFLELHPLKYYAVQLFKIIVKIDAFLMKEIVESLDQYVNSNVPQNRHNVELILIINIIKDEVTHSEHLSQGICDIVLVLAHRRPPLREQATIVEHFEYALSLVTVSSYLDLISNKRPRALEGILELALELISNNRFYEAIRFIGQILVEDIICLHSKNEILLQKLISELTKNINKNSHKNTLNQNIFDILFFLLQKVVSNNPITEHFRNKKLHLIDGILSQMCESIETEVNKKRHQDKTIINKCWNIVRIIGENSTFVHALTKSFQQIISRLVFYLENNKSLDFEEDCFILMSSFIRYSHQISHFVTAIFPLIPKIFYGYYQRKFGHSFQALQMLLYYGTAPFFAQNEHISRSILQMSLSSLQQEEEVNAYEGILLLQSFLLSKTELEREKLDQIQIHIQEKIKKKSETKFLQRSLAGALGLCLQKSAIEWVEPNELNNFINVAYENISRCPDIFCLKMTLFAFCELFLKHNLKYFEFHAHQVGQILQHLNDQEKKRFCHENKSSEVLKLCTINEVTKTSMETYRNHFIGKINGKYNELSPDSPLLDILNDLTMQSKGRQMQEQWRKRRPVRYK